jgi:hypothetical protein
VVFEHAPSEFVLEAVQTFRSLLEILLTTFLLVPRGIGIGNAIEIVIDLGLRFVDLDPDRLTRVVFVRLVHRRRSPSLL